MYTPTRLTAIALLFATSLQAQPPQRMVRSQIPEPYPVLTATPSGEAVPESPDPLVRYRLGESIAGRRAGDIHGLPQAGDSLEPRSPPTSETRAGSPSATYAT